MKIVVVLPDGETWSVLEGCKILALMNEEFQHVCEDTLSLCHVAPVIEVDLNRLISGIHPKILKENG